MTCQEALRLLYEVIDKEAAQLDVEKVKEHLDSCESCMSRYEFERMFKTFVSERAVSSTRTEKLKEKILYHIEDAERESVQPAVSRTRTRVLYLAAAAALVLFITAAMAVGQFYRHQKYVYPFEKDHLDAAGAIVSEGADPAETAPMINFLSSNLHLAVETDMPGLTLIHSSYDEIRGQRYVHLQYRDGNAPVSIFIGNASSTYLPGFVADNSTGLEFFKHLCTQCQVVYWRRGNIIIIAVSKDKKVDLPSLYASVNPI